MSNFRSDLAKESFTIRYVKLHHPQVAVLLPTALAITMEFRWIVRVLALGKRPFSRSIKLRHPFISAQLCVVFATYYQQCPGIAFTLCDNRREPSGGLDCADEAGDFEMGWYPIVHRPIPGRDTRRARKARYASA